MKNYNFNYVKDIEGEYLEVELKDLTKEDEVSVKVLSEDVPPFMLPFAIERRDDQYKLRYTTSSHVALSYRLEDFFASKEEYINLGLQVIGAFSKVIDWMTDYHSLIANPEYVFQNKKTGKIYFTAAPSRDLKSTDAEIIDFIKVVLTTPRTDERTAPFQNNVFRYFNEDDVNFEELYQMFTEEGSKIEGLVGGRKAVAYEDVVSSAVMTPSFGNTPLQNSAISGSFNAQQGTINSASGSFSASAGSFVASPSGSSTPVKDAQPKNSSNHIFADFGKSMTPSFLNSNPMDAKKNQKEDKNKTVAEERKAEKEREKERKAEEKARKEQEKKEKKEKEKGGGLFGFGKKAERKDKETESAQQEPVQQEAAAEFDPFANVEVQRNVFDHSDETVYARDAVSGIMISDRLRLVDSPLPGAPIMIDLNFTKHHIVIGRLTNNGPGCDIRFPDSFQSIGRQHAWIEKDGEGHYFIVDLDSSNGTLLNGHALIPNQKYSLKDGDEVAFSKIQPVKYKVEIKE